MSSFPQIWSFSPKQRVEISMRLAALTAAQPDFVQAPNLASIGDVFTSATSLINWPAIERANPCKASRCDGLALSSTINTALPLRGSYFILPSVASVRTTAITLRPSRDVPCQLPSLTDQTIMASLPTRPISALAKQGPV